MLMMWRRLSPRSVGCALWRKKPIFLLPLFRDGKKRGRIPPARKAEITQHMRSRSNVNTVFQKDIDKPVIKEKLSSAPIAEKKPLRMKEADGDIKRDILEHIEERMKKREQSLLAKNAFLSSVLVLGCIAALAIIFWPKQKADPVQTMEVQMMQEQIDALQAKIDDLENTQPENPDSNISSYIKDLEEVRDSALNMIENTREVSVGMMQAEIEDMEDRLKILADRHSPFAFNLGALKERLNAMLASPEGSEVVEQAVESLQNYLEGAKNSSQTQNALESAQKDNPAVQETLQGVPKEDLKAAVMLLAFTQFRNSLNRDNTPFAEDLAVLQNLVGENNPQLQASIQKLAPQAQRGVLTPSGLSDELKLVAGDVVVASLKGEDVSVKDKARARIGEILEIEKDGDIVSGTPTQNTLAKAEKHLEAGDLRQAVAAIETLEGDALKTVAPWLKKAKASLYAHDLEQALRLATGQTALKPYDMR